MSGYEEQLHARAELLDETGELAAAVTEILDGAADAGLDPHAITSLRTAIRELDPAGAPPGYHAGDRTDRHPGDGYGYGSDAEFLEAVSDAEDQALDWLRDAGQLQEQTIAALDVAHDDRDRAQRDVEAARQALAAAYAMATKKDCDGCHGIKAAAINAAETAIADAEERVGDTGRRIGICEDTAEILDSLTGRLQAALQALRQVPHDLGEVYELIYAFIRRGGKMPRPGRWITGETRFPPDRPGRAPACRDFRARPHQPRPIREASPIMTATTTAPPTPPWDTVTCVTALCSGCGASAGDEDEGYTPHFTTEE